MNDIARQSIIESSITKIGSIIESEDKFICKVEQENVRWIRGTLKGWHKNISDEVLETNGLNKPIYYIFDGIEFKQALSISLENQRANLIFRNCTFKNGIYLEDCCDVEFENNTYDYSTDLPIDFFENYFLIVNRIGKLTFKNDNFTNCTDRERLMYLRMANVSHRFGMYITNTKEVEFVNTRVETYFSNAIFADTIRLENSILDGTEFALSAKTIENNDSTITATESVTIKNLDCDFAGIIESPHIFYNGEDVTNYGTCVTTINREEIAKREARVALIDTLHKVEDEALQRITTSVGDIYGIKPNARKRVPQNKSLI